jgi:hypothetical protein
VTNRFAKAHSFKYNEAFCLMLYQCKRTGHVIDIWNSRDGVTPFMCDIDGEEYGHIAFSFDRRVPDFKPKPGMYIWRTATRADGESVAKQEIASRGVPEGMSVESFTDIIVNDVLHDGEGPWLEKVA